MLQVILFTNHQSKDSIGLMTSGYMVPHQSASPAETSSEDLSRVKGKLL